MAILKSILHYKSISLARSYQENKIRRAERLVVAWIIFVLLARFIANCFFSFNLISINNIFGLVTAEFNFIHIMAVWIVIPFLIVKSAYKSRGLTPNRLYHLPLSKNQLVLLDFSMILLNPIFLVLILISLFALIPLFQSTFIIPGVLTGLAFIFFVYVFLSLSVN